jgi:autotransporter-associated beta strand protein
MHSFALSPADAARGLTFAPSRSALRLLAAIAALPPTLPAAALWTGQGADANWSTPQNWDPAFDAPPAGGPATQLTFAGSDNLSPVADSPFTLRSLAFASGAAGFSLSGSTLTLAGSLTDDPAGSFIANDSVSSQTIANDLVLGAFTYVKANMGDLGLSGSVALDNNGATFSAGSGMTLTVDGDISGTGLLTTAGDGTIRLTQDNTAGGGVALGGNSSLVLGAGGAAGSIGGILGGTSGTTIVVNRSDDLTLANYLAGDSSFVHAGSGALTLASSNGYNGSTSVVGGGALVLQHDEAAGGSTAFLLSGSGSTLRIESGITLAADIDAGADTLVDVLGTLTPRATGSAGSRFTDATLRVGPGGRLDGNTDFDDDATEGYFLHGDSVLQLDTADAVGPDAYLEFHDSASIASTTPGAILDGWFVYFGGDPDDVDAPVRALTLPGPGVIAGGLHELAGKISLDLDQTGMITGYTDIALYDSATLVLSAPRALGGAAPLDPDTDETDILLDLYDASTVRLEADDALRNTSLAMGDDSRFILNGHSVTLSNLGAFGDLGARIVNNSATPATFILDTCGCGPSAVFGDVFADQDDSYGGTSAPLSLDFRGSGYIILDGVQRHTGSTTVTGPAPLDPDTGLPTDPLILTVYGAPDTDTVVRGLASSPLELNGNAILAGAGPVADVTVNDGAGLSPGDGAFFGPLVDTLSTGSVALSGDTTLTIDLSDAAPLAGELGWDALNVAGLFSFSSTLGESFTVSLRTGDGVSETIANFDETQSYSFAIVTASGGFANYTPSSASVSLAALASPPSGSWSVRITGDSLYLDYAPAPVPEPATAAAFAALAALGFSSARRRRRA